MAKQAGRQASEPASEQRKAKQAGMEKWRHRTSDDSHNIYPTRCASGPSPTAPTGKWHAISTIVIYPIPNMAQLLPELR